MVGLVLQVCLGVAIQLLIEFMQYWIRMAKIHQLIGERNDQQGVAGKTSRYGCTGLLQGLGERRADRGGVGAVRVGGCLERRGLV